ncbi:MAG: Adenosylcobinamide-GDP ribazoletransferase [Thermodesulfobacteriota bacterium]|nr:Adenosylcobinamide-GDP ribazoletransferase [Thermodesulfobacteriota bacterium]
MKSFLAAIQFLTIIPMPGGQTIRDTDIESCVRFFPVVGLLIGCLVALCDHCISGLFPSLPAAVLTVLALLIITGGLHMDGLADTADGVFSVRARERMLAIMRDSRIGAMGVLAMVFIIALKIAALVPLPLPQRLAILVLMPIGGRFAMLLMLTALPYARKDGGLATLFITRRSWLNPVFAIIFLGASGWFVGAWMGLVATLAAVVAAGLVSWYIYLKLGGFTGDTIGAASEITETVLALVGLACIN